METRNGQGNLRRRRACTGAGSHAARNRTSRARADRCVDARAGADVLHLGDRVAAARHAAGRFRFLQTARARSVVRNSVISHGVACARRT